MRLHVYPIFHFFVKSNDNKDKIGTWVDIFLSIHPENQTDMCNNEKWSQQNIDSWSCVTQFLVEFLDEFVEIMSFGLIFPGVIKKNDSFCILCIY